MATRDDDDDDGSLSGVESMIDFRGAAKKKYRNFQLNFCGPIPLDFGTLPGSIAAQGDRAQHFSIFTHFISTFAPEKCNKLDAAVKTSSPPPRTPNSGVMMTPRAMIDKRLLTLDRAVLFWVRATQI